MPWLWFAFIPVAFGYWLPILLASPLDIRSAEGAGAFLVGVLVFATGVAGLIITGLSYPTGKILSDDGWPEPLILLGNVNPRFVIAVKQDRRNHPDRYPPILESSFVVS